MISDLRGVDFASFHIKPTITDETWEWILQSFCDEYNKYRADESHISLEQFKDKVLTSDGFISCANLGFVRVSQGTYYSDSLQPTFNDKTVAVPGRDGSYYFGSNYTEKTWTLQVAYDGMTEMQIRAVSLLFASDTKMWDLYFDERPYKVYHVKIASPVDLSYICFDEKIPGGDCFLSAYLSDKQREESEEIHIFHNHELKPESLSSFKAGKERIYKGEGTLALKCCTPFARQRFKYLEQYDESNVGEWATASRLLPSKEYQGEPHTASNHTIYFSNEQPGSFKYGSHTAWISGTAFCFVNGHTLQVDNVVEYDSWVHGNCITHNAGDMDAHWSELIAYNPTNVTENDYVNSEAVGLEEDTDYYVFNDQASTMEILGEEDKEEAPKGSSVEDAPYRYYTRSTAKEEHSFPRFENSQLAIFENRPSDQTISAGDFILVKQVSFDQDFPDSVSNRSDGMEINDNMYISALTDENGVLSRYWTVFIDEAGNYTYQLRNLRTGAELTSLDENKEYNQNDAVCAYKWVKENGEYYVSLYDVVTTNDPITHSGLFGNNWDSAIYSDKTSADEYKRNWVINIYKCHEGEDIVSPKGFVLSLDTVPENGKRYYTIKDQSEYYKKVGSSYALIDFKSGNYLIDGNILKEKNASEEYVEIPYYKKQSGSYILADDLTLEELTIYYYKEAPAQYFEFDPQTTNYYVKDGDFYTRSEDDYPQPGVTYYLRVPSSDSYMSFEIIKYPLNNPDGTKNYLRVDKLKTIDGDDYLSINSKNNLIEGVTRDLEKTGNVYNRYKTEGVFFLLNRGESQISIRAIHPDGTRSPINPYVVDPDYVIENGNLILGDVGAEVEGDRLESPEEWSIYQGNLTVNGDVITDLHSNFRYF